MNIEGRIEGGSTSAILAMGSYVPTDNMSASRHFYRNLFDSEPAIELDDFIAFNVAGGWFAIVTRERYAPGSAAGYGSVPYLQSGNLDELRSRLMRFGLNAPEIIEEPGIHLLKVTDPNGQLIEFFHLVGQ